MKSFKTVLFSSIIFLILNCSASMFEKTPPELLNKDFEYIFALDSLSKDEAFAKGKLWIAESYNSAESVITFEDLETGSVKGTAIGSALTEVDYFERSFKYSLSIYFKENKTKLVFSNVQTIDYKGVTGLSISAMTHYRAIKSYFDDLANNYSAFMKDDTSDDW
jgi:hypothetical protein